MSLPCARGGGRRGTSLTEGLLHTRESDFYTPSASHPFGTSLEEGAKKEKQNAKKEKPDEFPHRAFPCYWTINQPDCS